MAQFLLIASLALGSSSAFAEENSSPEFSSQMIVEAEEFISEELKSIYQEEVDQILAEGISYSEEERLSDFPDLDSLLADEVVPTRVAKISKYQKEEKGKSSASRLGVQNLNMDSEIFSEAFNLSQNCLFGKNVLLADLRLGRVGQEFLPRAQVQDKTGGHKSSPIKVHSYANSLSDCPGIFSPNVSGEGPAMESVCLIENQRNLHLGSGVPTTADGYYLRKTAENALGFQFGMGVGQILDIARVSGQSYKNWTFSPANKLEGLGIGKSAPVYSGGQAVAVEFSREKVGAWIPRHELQSSLEKVASKAGQDSYKFSSGRPTPEILT